MQEKPATSYEKPTKDTYPPPAPPSYSSYDSPKDPYDPTTYDGAAGTTQYAAPPPTSYQPPDHPTPTSYRPHGEYPPSPSAHAGSYPPRKDVYTAPPTDHVHTPGSYGPSPAAPGRPHPPPSDASYYTFAVRPTDYKREKTAGYSGAGHDDDDDRRH